MNKLWILGIGPGHEDYVLPIVKKKIKMAEVVFGSKRHLEMVPEEKGKLMTYPFEETMKFICDHFRERQMAILVSGDTGFFSLTKYIKQHLKAEDLELYPGISSLQYMFAKLHLSYDDAFCGSMHGKNLNLKDLCQTYKRLGLLTDQKHSPAYIGEYLHSQGFKGWIHVGHHLSYDDEVIESFELHQWEAIQTSSLNVVVIDFE